MDDKIRSLLYEGSGLSPLFNPMSATEDTVPSPLVVDMTVDIANHGRIYHPNTDEVRALVEQANAVVTDSERMSSIARRYTKGLVVSAPFGFTTVQDRETPFTVGLLNYTEEQEMANKILRKFYKALKSPFLVFGKELDWTEKENEDNRVTDDWELFCGEIDVLLLVGSSHVVPSFTLPVSAMMAGAVILATNHYSSLQSASGVFILSGEQPKLWAGQLQKLESNLRRLDSLKQFNANYARQISRESQALIFKLAKRLS